METTNIYKQLAALQSEVEKVTKGGTNEYHHYQYARLGDILDVIRPLLKRHGLGFYQSIDLIETSPAPNGKDISVTVRCTTFLFTHNNMEEIKITSIGSDSGDKAAYKATTGARKYGLTALFGLDWDATEPEDEEAPTPKQTTAKRKVF